MKSFAVLLYFSCLFSVGLMQMAPLKDGLEWNGLKSLLPMPIDPLKLNQVNQTFCTCGVFFSGQFKRGSTEQPKGPPVLMHEQDFQYPCTPLGSKQCSNKCLEVITRHLPNSPAILCGSIDREVFRERAYLFIQDCKSQWINTNFSAGREFCCKDGSPYKCPNSLI